MHTTTISRPSAIIYKFPGTLPVSSTALTVPPTAGSALQNALRSWRHHHDRRRTHAPAAGDKAVSLFGRAVDPTFTLHNHLTPAEERQQRTRLTHARRLHDDEMKRAKAMDAPLVQLAKDLADFEKAQNGRIKNARTTVLNGLRRREITATDEFEMHQRTYNAAVLRRNTLYAQTHFWNFIRRGEAKRQLNVAGVLFRQQRQDYNNEMKDVQESRKRGNLKRLVQNEQQRLRDGIDDARQIHANEVARFRSVSDPIRDQAREALRLITEDVTDKLAESARQRRENKQHLNAERRNRWVRRAGKAVHHTVGLGRASKGFAGMLTRHGYEHGVREPVRRLASGTAVRAVHAARTFARA